MDYNKLLALKEIYNSGKHKIDAVTLSSYEKDFELTFTHNSTAIEGNTLTLMETKVVLEDGISIGGKELREIYEIVNHKKAYGYVKKCIAEGKPLDERLVKDIHAILTENIILGGADMSYKLQSMNPIELAAWTHAEFVRIHPFIDGNGRTSRLIMNYQLMINGFLPVSIAKENRLEYYNALEAYAVSEDLNAFADLIAQLEETQLEQYIKLIK